MSSSLPVLVIMLADNCAHCANFKRNFLNKFRELVKSYGKVTLVEINFKDYTKPVLDPSYPSDLLKIRAYPSFNLIPASTWANGKAGNPMKNILTYGIMFKDGNMVQVPVPAWRQAGPKI